MNCSHAQLARAPFVFVASRWRHFVLLAVAIGIVSYPALAYPTQQVLEGQLLSKSTLRKRIEEAAKPVEELLPIPAEFALVAPPELEPIEPPPVPNRMGEPQLAQRAFVSEPAPTPAKREPTLARPRFDPTPPLRATEGRISPVAFPKPSTPASQTVSGPPPITMAPTTSASPCSCSQMSAG